VFNFGIHDAGGGVRTGIGATRLRMKQVIGMSAPGQCHDFARPEFFNNVTLAIATRGLDAVDAAASRMALEWNCWPLRLLVAKP
jgi:hypothetical protein